MANPESANDLSRVIYGVLVDKVRDDRFPSATVMDMIENGMDDRVRRDYLQALIDKVSDERFPSIDMIRRVIALL